MSGHVASYKCWKNDKTNSYVTSFKRIEGNDYYIELLEAVSCSSFDELAKKERYYIESIDCINKQIPGRKIQEWRQDNEEKINQKQKQYDQDNKVKIKARKSVKVKCSKCGSVVTKDGLSRHQRTIKCQNAADILQELDEITN